MYKGWRITRWDTPVVDLDRLLMVSLTDAQRELVVVVEEHNSSRRRWRVRFHDYPAYRNIDEMHRTSLWRWLDESKQRCGNTFIVDEQPRLASWGCLDFDQRHFVIVTSDDVVEVVSGAEPIWEAIEAGGVDDPPPGKSTHLHLGEDDEKIERLMEDLKSRKKPH